MVRPWHDLSIEELIKLITNASNLSPFQRYMYLPPNKRPWVLANILSAEHFSNEEKEQALTQLNPEQAVIFVTTIPLDTENGLPHQTRFLLLAEKVRTSSGVLPKVINFLGNLAFQYLHFLSDKDLANYIAEWPDIFQHLNSDHQTRAFSFLPYSHMVSLHTFLPRNHSSVASLVRVVNYDYPKLFALLRDNVKDDVFPHLSAIRVSELFSNLPPYLQAKYNHLRSRPS